MREYLKKLIDNGVIVDDAITTYVSDDSVIESGVRLQPNVTITGVCKIASGSIIGANSVLDNAIIGENVRIRSSYIEDSEIGSNSQIGPFTYIRNHSKIGNNCRIGDFVELKSAVIGDNTKAAHLAYIGDAELGSDVNVGCGCVFANYNGKIKNKICVGNNVFIGANANLVAPLIIGSGAFIAAGSTVTDDVPSGNLCIARARQVNKCYWKDTRSKE